MLVMNFFYTSHCHSSCSQLKFFFPLHIKVLVSVSYEPIGQIQNPLIIVVTWFLFPGTNSANDNSVFHSQSYNVLKIETTTISSKGLWKSIDYSKWKSVIKTYFWHFAVSVFYSSGSWGTIHLLFPRMPDTKYHIKQTIGSTLLFHLLLIFLPWSTSPKNTWKCRGTM